MDTIFTRLGKRRERERERKKNVFLKYSDQLKRLVNVRRAVKTKNVTQITQRKTRITFVLFNFITNCVVFLFFVFLILSKGVF